MPRMKRVDRLVIASLNGSFGYNSPNLGHRYWGPGQDIEIPDGLAMTLGVPYKEIEAEAAESPTDELTIPEDLTIECDQQIPACDPDQVTTTDNCSEVTVSCEQSEPMPDDEDPCLYIVTNTYTATDFCGNSTTLVQTISIYDNTPPEFNDLPQDETVECDSLPDAPDLTASDNCDPNPSVSYSETLTEGVCSNSYTLYRTWTATDACGNTSSATQVILTSANGADINITEGAEGLFTNVTSAAGETFQAGLILATDVGADGAAASASYTISGAGTGLADTGLDTITYARNILNDVDVLTGTTANDALQALDFALDNVNSLRAELGAVQTRFESTISNLSITSENLSAARSRIRDADFAAETAELTRSQILQQAGIAILSQANALPQNVLALLQ